VLPRKSPADCLAASVLRSRSVGESFSERVKIQFSCAECGRESKKHAGNNGNGEGERKHRGIHLNRLRIAPISFGLHG